MRDYPKMSEDVDIESPLDLFVSAVEKDFPWYHACIIDQNRNLNPKGKCRTAWIRRLILEKFLPHFTFPISFLTRWANW